MKKFLKILGIALGVILLLIAGLASYVQFAGLPHFETKELPVELPTDSLSLAHGKRVVETICISCHLGEDGRLSGMQFSKADEPFGEIWSANLTQHPEKGALGRYSNGELAYLMRTGVKRDGKMAGYFMSFPSMSDADMASIIAYLRSDAPLVQPSEASHPAPKYSFLAKALIHFGVFKPLPYEGKPIVTPPITDKVAYGRYLATGVFECYNCHSASFETNLPTDPEKSPGLFGGGNLMKEENGKSLFSANITADKTTGIGNWTEAQFVEAVKTGKRPDDQILDPIMPRFSGLSDEEVGAIWAYLQTVPALEHEVTR